ncbi:hypothetical protein E4U53_005476 [Claviceps sorghi]|nr:hypothetical protein E4U53_005476 [Claviceps sorghi]
MASLRNIMNVDVEDDHVDSPSSKDPGSKTSQDPDSSGRGLDHPLDTSPSRNQGMNPSTRSIQSLSIGQDTSDMPFNHLATRNPSGRRQSNTSADSLDSNHARGHGHRHGRGQGHSQSHRHNHAHTGSIPNVPPRPHVSQQETAVKLTPITGRTFTRAEHLRRHQLSHQPPDLPCPVPGCDKVFHRRDLLERHQQRHDQEDRVAKPRSSGQARSNSGGRRRPSYATSSPPGSLIPLQQSYGKTSPTATTPGISVSSGHYATHKSTPVHLHQANTDVAMEGIRDEYMLDAVSNAQTTTASTAAEFSQPRSMPAIPVIGFVQNVCVPRAVPPAFSWPATAALATATAQATFSQPNIMETNARGSEFSLSHAGWASIQQATSSTMPGSMMVTSGDGFPVPYTYGPPLPPSYTSIYNEESSVGYPGYDGSPVLYGAQNPTPEIHSPSPPFVSGRSSETMVTVPAALPADRVVSTLAYRRDPILGLGMQPQDILTASLSREVQSALPTYMDVYWDKVHPLYPIIHRATVEDGIDNVPEQVYILCCAMAAVATQFLGHREHRINGSLLHAYAWQKSKAFTQSARWSLPAMQCILLCEYYARFRGRHRDDHHPSSRFLAMYQMVSAHSSASIPKLVGTKYQRWTAWIYLESCRRLLSACFLLSVHGMCYHELPYSTVLGVEKVTSSGFHIPLSGSTTSLWEAADAEAWADIDMSSVELTTVGDVMQDEKASNLENPAFDVSLVIAAHALGLPTRKKRQEVELVQDISGFRSNDLLMSKHFGRRPGATTYLALHHTPLHVLLSVSGDSWAFNRKIPNAKLFAEHKKKLRQWRDSGTCAIATVFAARALREFLSLSDDAGQAAPTTAPQTAVSCKDISDYWGLYVCTLICWAFGHPDKRSCTEKLLPARTRATAWIQAVADMEPSQLQASSGSEDSQAIVAFVREILDKDCLGGRNMLYADSVGVLRKLEEVDNYEWF